MDESGQWTHSLIFDIRKRLNGALVVQHPFESGTDRSRLKLSYGPRCLYCGEAVNDAEHSEFRCAGLTPERQEVSEVFEESLSPENKIYQMTAGETQ